MDSAQKFNDI